MGVFDYRGPDLNMNGIPDWDEAQASPVTQGALAAPQAQMSPVPMQPQGPAPGAPVGAPVGSPGIMMPPEMSGFERGLSGIYNLGTMMGGNGPQLNPITQAFDQRVKNYELQNARLNAIRSGAANEDPLVRGVKQFAQAAGITNLPWDEQVAAYRKAKFADPRKSVYTEKVEGLVASGIDETLANQYVNGAVEARTGPGGITQLVNKLTGEVEQTLTAEQAAAIESTIAESKSFADTTAQKNAEKVAGYMTRINEIAVAGVAFDQTMQQIDGWVDRLEGGDLETGLVSGFLTELGLMGTELEGEALADSVEQALYNLQITNLAPVTEKEIQFIKGLFMDLKSPTEVNIGKLKAALKRISRQIEMADYEAQTARDFVLEFGDDTQKGFINRFFPANIGLEEAKRRAQGGGV